MVSGATAEEVREIIRALPRNPDLQQLHLFQGQYGEEMALGLLEAIQEGARHLLRLDLHQSQLTSRFLGALFAKPFPMNSVDLSNNQIDDIPWLQRDSAPQNFSLFLDGQFLVSPQQIFTQIPSISRCSLSGCGLGDKELKKIIQVIRMRHQSTIKGLDLSSNRITNIGCAYLCNTLLHTSSYLEEISLQDNLFSEAGRYQLVKALEVNFRVTSFLPKDILEGEFSKGG